MQNSISCFYQDEYEPCFKTGALQVTLTTRFEIGNSQFIFDSACERVGLLSRCACEASPGACSSVDGLFAHLRGLKTVLGDTEISQMTII